MTTHSVERHLGLAIEEYDREIRRLVPHYDELVDEGVALLRALVVPEARILDLGCGTGRLSAALLDGLPKTTVVALDVDPRALDQARRRLASSGDRVSFVEGNFHDRLPDVDAVVASLSLHHIRELDTKIRVYRSIFDSLRPGAPFVILDATVSADPVLCQLTFDRWAASMAAHGIDEATARKHFADWSREERYVPLRDELEALARAGFEFPECFWRRGPVAIYGGRRAR